MPHLTLDYSANLLPFDASALLMELNRALVASEQFDEIEIKSRAIHQETFVIGTSPDNRAYVHLQLAMLSGRSVETKQALSDSLLEILRDHWGPSQGLHVQLCVEIREIERESYGRGDIFHHGL